MIKKLRNGLRPLVNQVHANLLNLSNRKIEKELTLKLASIPINNPHRTIVERPLLDGHFHNAGYWYRLQLLRSSLGTPGGNELAFVWKYNQRQCRNTLRQLGVSRVESLFDISRPTLKSDAKRLSGMVRRGEDVLDLRLPHDLPPSFLYDAILKRQRAASVNGKDPLIEQDIQEFIISIAAAETIIESHDPDLIAMSHTINTQCSPMAWLGTQNGIPVVTLFGNYGAPRFWRMNRPSEIYHSVDCPNGYDLDQLTDSQAAALADVGRRYLTLRISGRSNDLGGRMAFSGNVDPSRLQATRDSRPVVAIYASNWFDFPHALGMSRFRDFLDWIQATLTVALATPSVRWLFRAHPCDKWYGGMTLKDSMPSDLPEHIVLVPEDWPGSLVMDVADAVVTYHGTAAIEYAALGKPVLIPDRGWYHDCGFALFPDSRDHYLELLSSDWFNRVDVRSAKHRAETFAGWYFCVPEWQADAIMSDDSDRTHLKKQMARRIGENGSYIDREISLIREWIIAGEHGYHTFKMKQAKDYSLSNVSG